MTALKVGLIGRPVAHSRSPEIFASWAAGRGVRGSYELMDVGPSELSDTLLRLAEAGWHGFNVTAPHKVAVMEHVLVPEAVRAVGAVNTVVRGAAGWEGRNTDVGAVLGALAEVGFSARGRRVVVLGAGGAAAAACHALRVAEQITVVSRRQPLSNPIVSWRPWHDPPLATADLLVNCTPVGMAGGPEPDPDWGHLPWADLSPSAVVFDMVYAPRRTRLLAEAEGRGHRTVDGLAMLRRQGPLAYEQWLLGALNP